MDISESSLCIGMDLQLLRLTASLVENVDQVTVNHAFVTMIMARLTRFRISLNSSITGHVTGSESAHLTE